MLVVTRFWLPPEHTGPLMAGADHDLPAPMVRLGHLSENSIAPSVYVLVRHGAQRRSEMAAAMRGSVQLRFGEGHAPVRIDFCGDVIDVIDDDEDEDRACDLVLTGRLSDVNALIVAPLAGGLPKPTTRRGRSAIARLADGRVDFDGPLSLGRSLLRLLAIDAVPTTRKPSAAVRETPAA